MPLTEFFADQLQQIRFFLLHPAQVVRVVRIDSDLKPVLLRVLVKMDDDPENAHAMLYTDAEFAAPEPYFLQLLDQLEADYRKNAGRLETIGCAFSMPYDDGARLHPAPRFSRYATALADALPDSMGSLVFLLDPVKVADPDGFRRVVEYLARRVESPWLKFLVLDSRLDPLLNAMDAELDRVETQTFYLPPKEIEKRLKESAARPDPTDLQAHRRNLGVLAGFAFGRRDYQEATRLQFEWARLSEEEDSPTEAASAYYNLGNTMLETGALVEAEQSFVRSCELCLEHSVNGVLPLVLTNLGIALFRQNRLDEALESFRVAHRTFKAQKHRPGEAHVFDALAAVYYAQQRFDEAENAWLAAFDIYDGITSEPLADLRESGREDIRAKLDRFYRATGRPNRIDGHQPRSGAR